jgi:GTP-binding protein HflX
VTGTAERSGREVAVSALTGAGTDRLLSRVDDLLAHGRQAIAVEVPLSDGETLAWLYRRGEVLDRRDRETTAVVSVLLDPADLSRLGKKPGVRIRHRYEAAAE